MKPKLGDVAKLAGVSPTTVSRVINNYGYISQKTNDKVIAAMKELNYQPNSVARSLQGKKTNLVGIIFPGVSNIFFGELVERLENKLFDDGYKAILCNAAYNKEKERSYLNMLISNQVDGIITGAHNLGIEEYQNLSLPSVSFDRDHSSTIPVVSSDNYQGGVIATKKLISENRQKIYFLGNPEKENHPTGMRLKGYLDTMEKNNKSPNFMTVKFSDSPLLKRVDIENLLLSEKPDGIVCTDDLTAIEVIQTARKLNIKVPTQLSVIGYDGTEFIKNYFPELSTIEQPIDELATLLVKLLEEQIDGTNISVERNYKLPVRFINSNSTK